MIAKLIPIVNDSFVPPTIGYRFWCPACKALHPIYIVKCGDCPVWQFNGDLDNPSFSPSLRMIQENNCHLYVVGGQISYCSDCKHELRNTMVPLVDFDLERWCPVDALHTVNGKPVEVKKDSGSEVSSLPPAAVSTTHRAECGNVGLTGQHGDIGSNGR